MQICLRKWLHEKGSLFPSQDRQKNARGLGRERRHRRVLSSDALFWRRAYNLRAWHRLARGDARVRGPLKALPHRLAQA